MSPAAPAPDYLVVGHLCLDYTLSVLSEGRSTPPGASEAAAAEAGPEPLGGACPERSRRARGKVRRAGERVDPGLGGGGARGGEEAEWGRLAPACRLLVATEGPRGARVYWNRDVRRFPSPAADPVDPTGAGDILPASSLIRYHQTHHPWQHARFPTVLASTSVAPPPAVTRRGLAGVPTSEEAKQAAMVWAR